MCQLLGWTTFPRIPFPCVFPLSMGFQGKVSQESWKMEGGQQLFCSTEVVADQLSHLWGEAAGGHHSLLLLNIPPVPLPPGCVCSAPRVCASFCRLSSFPRSNVTRTDVEFSSSLWDFSLRTWSSNLLVIFPSWPPNWYLTGLRQPCRDGLSSVLNCRSQVPVEHELYIYPDSWHEPCPIKEVRDFRDKIPYLLQRDRWKWWHKISEHPARIMIHSQSSLNININFKWMGVLWR